jgi:hypothetical protein
MRSFVVYSALTLASLPTAALADVTVGTPTGINCFPFTCSGGNHYQQVFAASDFTSALQIQGLQFKSSTTYPVLSVSGGTFSIRLSTTSAAVDALSGTYANNIGSDNALLFSGTLASSFDGTYLRINFTGPFNYDPGLGNLLLDITTVGQTTGSGYFESMNGDAAGRFSRMQNYGLENARWGLVTTFLTGATPAVPEPASWALLIGGFAAVGVAMRRAAAHRAFA